MNSNYTRNLRLLALAEQYGCIVTMSKTDDTYRMYHPDKSAPMFVGSLYESPSGVKAFMRSSYGIDVRLPRHTTRNAAGKFSKVPF